MRLACACLAAGVCCAFSAWADPYDLGSDRFLFLDAFLLDETTGARLTVNPPSNIELVMIADRPWEKGGITSYGNVLQDPLRNEYRLYYVPVSWDVSPGFGYALATSKDGIHWEKPSLGAVEWQGSTDNNIVLWAQREGTVIIDPHALPERRYALISSHPDLKTRLFTSPDGIHFTMDERPLSALHSDSQISTFWDEDLGRYLHFPRVVQEGHRAVGMVQTTAMDEPWPDEFRLVMSGDERDPPELDLYTNACQKYALARNTYLGFPTPYYHYNPESRKYLNEPALAKGGKSNDGTIETQLAVSRDGVGWTRYRTPYIALGNYDGLDVKVAMVIPGLLFAEKKIYQYFMGYTFTHGDTQVRYGDGGRDLGGVFRAEQRIDGFVSLDFDYAGGTVTTGPFTFTGHRLLLNLNTSASGEARVAILDEAGNEVPGFGMDECRIINGDYLAATATWKDGEWNVSSLQGQTVRLRFACRGTKLYSFRFATAGHDAPYPVARAAGEAGAQLFGFEFK